MGILFICILIVLVVVIGDSIYLNRTFKLVHYHLEEIHDRTSTKAEYKDTKVVFLTDLHGQSYGNNNSKLIDAIKEQKPDMILIGGDMLVKSPEPDFTVALALVKELVKTAPVFYANGNHEKKVMEHWETSKDAFLFYKKQLEELGVKYLINDTAYVQNNGRTFEIIGLDLGLQHYQKMWQEPTLTEEEVEQSLPDRREKGVYRILLAHNPKYFEYYAKLDVDLVLSGHVHGGIMILPWLGGVIAPDLALFPEYDFGKFQSGDTTMVISRGLGTHSIRLRIFNVPEVSVIHL